MKFLTIENGQAQYTVDPTVPASKKIDQISKEDLLKLLDLCMKEDEFEMDAFDDILLKNKAHQIIYKNIFQKLEELRKQRIRFSDEMTVMYRTAINKYKAELSDHIED